MDETNDDSQRESYCTYRAGWVPTGENGVDGRLVEQMLGRQTLFNMGMKELEALWDVLEDLIDSGVDGWHEI